MFDGVDPYDLLQPLYHFDYTEDIIRAPRRQLLFGMKSWDAYSDSYLIHNQRLRKHSAKISYQNTILPFTDRNGYSILR